MIGNDERWPRHRGNGVVFGRRERSGVPWVPVLVVLAAVLLGAAGLAVFLVMPLLMAAGMAL